MAGLRQRTEIAARYLGFWGLTVTPFGPQWGRGRFFYGSSAKEAQARVEFAAQRGYSGVLVLGHPGMGKSWLLRELVETFRHPSGIAVYLSALGRSREIFLSELALHLGITAPPNSAAMLWREVTDRLLAVCLLEQPCLLAVDDLSEAESPVVECLGALTQMTLRGRQPTVLVASRSASGLAKLDRLADWLDFRIALEPWLPEEVTAFLAGRLQEAGKEPSEVFTHDAMEVLAQLTAGVPRHVNRLAEWCLIAAAGANVRPIDRDLVEEVYEEFYRHLDSDFPQHADNGWEVGVPLGNSL